MPTAETAQLPNYGRDDRVQLFRLDPLSEEQSEKLLQATGVKFDFSIRSWVIEQAGGMPGILLFAANLGNELRKSPEKFTENAAKTFETRVRLLLGEGFVEKIRLLSLLTHIGVDGNAVKEIEQVCMIFDSSILANSILNSLALMTETGIARIRGSYVEILPPLFANHLAKSALRGRFDKLVLLFAALDQNGRTRLVRRLRALKCDEANKFLDELFGANGLFHDLHSALNNIYLLRLVCGTVPEKVVSLLERGLKSATIDERLSIEKNVRRELMWTLEELLLRRKTSARALQCVALLAEAETENFSNNSQGVFCECFFPFHPQFPLTLDVRLKLVEGFFSSEHSIQTHLLGIKAIGLALRRLGLALALRYSSGPEPFEACPPATYADLWSYLDGMVDLLIKAATSENHAVANTASQALPRALEEYVYQARPESTVTRLKKIVDLVNTEKIPIESFELVQVLRDAHKTLTHHHVGIDKDDSEKLRSSVTELDILIRAFDKQDFPSRLKHWCGAYHQEDHEYEEVNGRRIYRSEKELQNLAEETVHNPDLLSDVLLEWLCSGEAEKDFMLFWFLGELDQKHVLMERIEKTAITRKGETAFSRYCGGLCQSDRSFVSNRLDEITVNGEVTAEAIVRATIYVGGDLAGVVRMEKLIKEKRVFPSFVGQCLELGVRIDSLNEEEFLRFLLVIVGQNLEHAAAVIDIFGSWLYHNKSIEGDLAEFAWQCLESCPAVNAKAAFHCDQLATKLTRENIERGFRLLKSLLTQPFGRDAWDPIDSRRSKNFWNALLEVDRNRAILLVLRTSSLSQIHLSDNSREIVSQENDADILLEFAYENEQQARYICQTIHPSRPGFWPIAFRIIEKFPDSSKIKTDLEWIIRMGGGGSWSSQYQQSSQEIETLLRDGGVPSHLRPWLEDLFSSLRNEAKEQLRSELDDQIEQSWHGKDHQNPDEQSWAIEQAILYGLIDELQRLFSKQQILNVLERMELGEQKKQTIRRKVEAWEN